MITQDSHAINLLNQNVFLYQLTFEPMVPNFFVHPVVVVKKCTQFSMCPEGGLLERRRSFYELQLFLKGGSTNGQFVKT